MNAEAGKLTIFASGNESTISEIRPLLETMGEIIYFPGGLGAACKFKLINNALAVPQILATVEAVSMSYKMGMDPEQTARLIARCSGRNFMTEEEWVAMVGDVLKSRN